MQCQVVQSSCGASQQNFIHKFVELADCCMKGSYCGVQASQVDTLAEALMMDLTNYVIVLMFLYPIWSCIKDQ